MKFEVENEIRLRQQYLNKEEIELLNILKKPINH